MHGGTEYREIKLCSVMGTVFLIKIVRGLTMEIRLANKSDVEDLMEFIGQNWKKEHILARDREFFEWMYVDGDQCHFEIAKENGKICGIYGFIPYSSKAPVDVGASIWKAVYCKEEPFVGLRVSEQLFSDYPIRHYLALGLSKKACRLARLEGRRTEAMKHFYRLGKREEYRIAVIRNSNIMPIQCRGRKWLPICNENKFCEMVTNDWLRTFHVYKDTAYLLHRYFQHPIYDYQCYVLLDRDEKTSSVFFTRLVRQNGSKMMKIIDFIGKPDDFSWIGDSIEEIIEREKLEYVDLYSYGIPEKCMKAAGFTLRKTDDNNIIPNYFEPFVQENVEINVKVPEDEIYMFRGDGDMDRPNYRAN